MAILTDLNNKCFLREAFDVQSNKRLAKAARVRKNIYLGLFLSGIACLCITIFINALLLSILSVGLSALSLVLMSRYSTQIYFLKTLRLRKDIHFDSEEELSGPELTE